MTSLTESSLPCMTRTKSITSPRAIARESRLSQPCRRRSGRDTSMPDWAASFTFPSKNTPRNIHLEDIAPHLLGRECLPLQAPRYQEWVLFRRYRLELGP